VDYVVLLQLVDAEKLIKTQGCVLTQDFLSFNFSITTFKVFSNQLFSKYVEFCKISSDLKKIKEFDFIYISTCVVSFIPFSYVKINKVLTLSKLANNNLYKNTNLSLDDIISKGSFVHNVAMLLI
jgi:uncharacterized membrane protein